MSEYLKVHYNGQIALPAPTRSKTKLVESDLLEAVIDADETTRLFPKLVLDRSMAKKNNLRILAGSIAE